MPNSGYEYELFHNAEGFVLEKLSTQHDSGVDPSIDIRELTSSIDATMSPLLDQAIEDLVAQRFIHSPDGENYQITQDDIDELENRKREAIPL